MRSPLDELAGSYREVWRPWGVMRWLDAPGHDLTVKHLHVEDGHRTSLQRHDRKDELIVITGGGGFIDVAGTRWHGEGCAVRILPGWDHRVTGPLDYLEISSYDDGADTIRLADDYGRVP